MLPVLFHLGPVLIPAYGALVAIGVLLALLLAERSARRTGLNSTHVWNLSVLAMFTGLVGSRLLLIALNWRDLRQHPMWLLGLATIHHPLLAAVGIVVGLVTALGYARWAGMPRALLADALAAPLALAAAFEQMGAFLAGSSYGLETAGPWAVTYTDPRAFLWSGTPLGIPLHPVQAYAALVWLAIAGCGWAIISHRRQAGDAAGITLLGGGAGIFVTEFLRDRTGRGALLGGALDGPQVAAIALVLAGGWMLAESQGRRIEASRTKACRIKACGIEEREEENHG